MAPDGASADAAAASAAALAALQAGDAAAAIAFGRRAAGLAPAVAGHHYTLGRALKAAGDLEGAIAAYRSALAADPGFVHALVSLGIAERAMGRLEAAAASYRQALTLAPDDPQVHHNLANVLEDLGGPEAVAGAYRELRASAPDSVDIAIAAGYALLRPETIDAAREAEACFRFALDRMPASTRAHVGLALARGLLGDDAGAAGGFDAALRIDPRDAETLLRYCGWLLDRGRYAQGLAAAQAAATLRPDRGDAYAEVGRALYLLDRPAEALPRLATAVRLDPRNVDAAMLRGMALLKLGRFQEGFEAFEARWRKRELAAAARAVRFPEWDGRDLAGRRVLLYAEQGFGDTIQFIRFAAEFRARGAAVTVVCPPVLGRIVATVPGVDRVVTRDGEVDCDVQCAVMSAPGRLGIRDGCFGTSVPYMTAPAAETAVFGRRLAAERGLRVGLVWSGNPRFGQRAGFALTDRLRSIPLDAFLPLAEVPGVRLVSVQKLVPGVRPAGAVSLVDWTDELHDFADTAALVANLDLVISVDTSVAHLAGALGRPVWLLSRSGGCWRWLLGRDDSPWYPTMRIYRQRRPLEWQEVIGRVANDLGVLAVAPRVRA